MQPKLASLTGLHACTLCPRGGGGKRTVLARACDFSTAATPVPRDTYGQRACRRASSCQASCSDGLLQRSGAECLHNGLCWLCLHDHSLACLGGWLQAGLDHAETRDGELAM